MTPRQIARQQLHEQMPNLLTGRSVIVLAAVDIPDESVVKLAWEFARVAADVGNTVALVDLSLEKPCLHSMAPNPTDRGIVDAFLFGASLEHVSHRQGTSSLYFIPAGSAASDPAEVWESERWPRLVRGFASQGAILLLFLPLSAVRRMPVTADLLVLLVDEGGATAGDLTELTLLEESGIPTVQLSRVVTTTPVALHRTGPAILAGPSDPPTRAERPKRRRLVGVGITGAAFVAAVLALALLVPGGTSPDSASAGAPGRGSERPTEDSSEPNDTLNVAEASGATVLDTAEIAASPPEQAVDTTQADSLYYSVQVAALSRFDDAKDRANRLSQLGFPATVTAFRQDESRLLYRVLVGAHRTAVAASAVREEMRERGILGPTTGVLMRTPLALQVQVVMDTAVVAETVAGLRDSGTPAYIVWMPGGTVRILTGAFETPEQARLTDSILSMSGGDLSFVIVPRTGTTR